MKKKLIGLLAAAAILSVAVAGIGEAHAYFTTYAEAKGVHTIRLGDETEIKENFESWRKELRIENTPNSPQAVWVRAKAFSGDDYKLVYTGQRWSEGEKGFWYYELPVVPGDHTDSLFVEIRDVLTDAAPEAEEGRNFNVVIVYETTPAVQTGEENGYITYAEPNWELRETVTE